MNEPNEIITNANNLMNAITKVNTQFKGQVWWRGQRNASWGLSPSVFRTSQRSRSEQSLISRFQHKAPSRHANVPSFDDRAGWLFLMQHYRLPTRVLDWTESPLIGCYFASECDPSSKDYPKKIKDTDGALFALSPYLLNETQIGQRALLLPDDQKALDSINRAFSRRFNDPGYIVAIRPAEVDVRLMVQLSVFTIHGSGLSIEDLPDNEKYLRKFIVPNSAKSELREQLKHLGIRESSIFPDLEHLALDVASTRFRIPASHQATLFGEDWRIPRDSEASS